LINEIFHRIIDFYGERRLPGLDRALADALRARSGAAVLDAALTRLADEFPPPPVAGGESAAAFLSAGAWPGPRGALLRGLLVLGLANRNPACGPLADLFDDDPLRRDPQFAELLAGLHAFFAGAPSFGRPGEEASSLLEFLRGPARAEPHSLPGQLRHI